MPVTIIAEAGVNHNGDPALARQLVDAAAGAGADIVKFQTWVTEELLAPGAPKAPYQRETDPAGDQFEMAKRLELPFAAFRELKALAESRGIGFLSTPDDEPSLDFLADELGLARIKIGSGEVGNPLFLRKVGAKRRAVILSTGMSELGEVRRAVAALRAGGAAEICLLHCVSSYPAPLEQVNLRAMCALAREFALPVGFSDHTEGSEAAVAAVALGASVIEKHLTLDRGMAGPDHRASLDPAGFADFVRRLRAAERALAGDGRKTVQPCERAVREAVAKGLYLRRNKRAGEALAERDLAARRPAAGVAAAEVDRVLGCRARRDLREGEPLREGDF